MERTLIVTGAAHVHLPDHLRVAREAGWRIAGVCDRDPARAEACAAALSVPVVEGPGAVEARAALVCSETVHHVEDCLAAFDAGLDVFCEKPLGGSADAARRIADAAEAQGRLLQTGYFMRTIAPLRELRARIAGGAIGRVTAARLRFSHDGGYADWLDLDCWMTDPGLACYGGFVDEAVHGIDALRWMLGPVARGHAVTGNVLGWPVDDHGAAILTFESGATAVVEAGWTDTRMRLELDLIGAAGGADLRDGVARLWTRDGVPEELPDRAVLDAGDGIRPFLRRLDGEEAPGLVPPHEAAEVNALIDAMGLARA
ncbi:Gfo/Idh/MocA family protein [Roseivivax isoporae]|uniref:Oxidoreductase n=1 Tax=Roseivivax isoporae LMG 25204 TaxID=1449351 RepID=X7F4L2_9RHOB|nr:Gfo/Idh/MocA family oxidoreductase [Roseivivax isoporae]ETX27668.1 hypothetical protein RISW2_12035 [Roseivivax isoporae LMG 25204]